MYTCKSIMNSYIVSLCYFRYLLKIIIKVYIKLVVVIFFPIVIFIEIVQVRCFVPIENISVIYQCNR